MADAQTTTDHKTIQRWAETRKGHPATVSATKDGDPAGLLRIDFESEMEDRLERISWETFFRKFDESDLAFLYQEKAEDGSISRFHKFVDRKSH